MYSMQYIRTRLCSQCRKTVQPTHPPSIIPGASSCNRQHFRSVSQVSWLLFSGTMSGHSITLLCNIGFCPWCSILTVKNQCGRYFAMANPSLYALTLYILLHISWHAAFFSINFIFLQTVYI